jgi:hydroxyethylthiazole kinase-like uncharacterized protein yjeF
MSGRGPLEVDDALLRGWPLPALDEEGDKESRGRVLVVAGSREMPGAAILAGTAALRAGAGKLAIATPASVAQVVAAAMPEARVIALPEAEDGSPLPEGVALLERIARKTACLLAGPGMIGREGTLAFVRKALPMFCHTVAVLDALALDHVRAIRCDQPVILTPHAGEMAHLTDGDKAAILADPVGMGLRHAAEWNAVVALKGATTCIATPGQQAWRHRSQAPGLGTSGSGDVLAGVIAGLAARGAPPEQAAVWGVALHSRAGLRLAERTGTLGFLARDLPAEVPVVMHALSTASR